MQEFREFMVLANKHMRKDIYRCMYLLTFGLRRGEAYGLRESSVTFLDKGLSMAVIDTQRTRNYRQGKSVKTKTSNRIVIFDEVATKFINDQIEYAKIIKANNKQIMHKDDFIFINPDGTPYPEKTLNDAINKIAKLMKKPTRITPHMFRHIFTTQAAADRKLNPLSLQTVLGHANLAMTQHYTHGSIESAKNVMEATRNMRLLD